MIKLIEEVFRDVFDDEIILSESTSQSDIEDWDSVAHVNILIALENEFGVKFSLDEAQSIKNVGDIIAIIQLKKDE